jgi:hypothetical protein
MFGAKSKGTISAGMKRQGNFVQGRLSKLRNSMQNKQRKKNWFMKKLL